MSGARIFTRLIVLAAVVAVGAALVTARHLLVPQASGVIDPATIAPEQGKAWTTPIVVTTPWWVRVPNDGLGFSSLRLFEIRGGIEQELGPVRAPPDSVRSEGGGRFNHWGQILFSTSDGSDPRVSGAIYRWSSATILAPRLQLALLTSTSAALLWVLSGWFAAMPRARVWCFTAVVAALAVSWNLEAARLYPRWINIDWDTASYLGWSPERTLGYPLLLELIALPTGDLRWLLHVQLNAMLAAFACLSLAVDRLLRARVIGLAVFVMLATSPRLMSFPFNVLTEAFFVVGTCLMMALLCSLARHDVRHALLRCLAVGALLAATELVRPAAFGLAGMLLLPVLWRRGRRVSTMVALAASYAAIMLLASALTAQRFGFLATSAMGPVSLLGHVAWNIRAETCPELPDLAARIEARVAPVVARRPAEMSWPDQYFQVTSDEYNELLWSNAMPETQAWVTEQFASGAASQGLILEGAARTRAEQVELTRVRGALARGALLSDVPAYARHVAAHVWGFWHSIARPAPLGPALKSRVPRAAESLERLWTAARALFAWMGDAPEVDSSPTPFDRHSWLESWRVAVDANPSFIWKLLVAATLAGVVLAPFSRHLTPAGRLLALAGVGFQGSALLVAAVTAVIARYVDAVEPLTVVAGAAALVCIGETLGRMTSKSRTNPTTAVPHASAVPGAR